MQRLHCILSGTRGILDPCEDASLKQPKLIDLERNKLPTLLGRDGLVGIELGVATGDYSRNILDSGLFSILYGVDLYGDHHNVDEYKHALRSIGLERNYRLLRMSFDEALDLFPDSYFDFIYVDGYAHTGENGGKTIFDWSKKVKVGGMLAGHDYHPDWPGVMKAVEIFIERSGLDLMVTASTAAPTGPQDFHPSWATIKTRELALDYSSEIGSVVVKAAGVRKDIPPKPVAKPNLASRVLRKIVGGVRQQ